MDFDRYSQNDALEQLDRRIAQNRMVTTVLLAGVLALRRRRRARERAQAQQRPPRRPRRWYVKPWVVGRGVHSQYRNLFEELDEQFDEDYRSYVRMDRQLFHEVLQRVAPRITKCPR